MQSNRGNDMREARRKRQEEADRRSKAIVRRNWLIMAAAAVLAVLSFLFSDNIGEIAQRYLGLG